MDESKKADESQPKAPVEVASGKSFLIARTLLEPELAEVLGVSVSTVRKLRYEGKIPYISVSGSKIIYLAESILAWLKRREINEGENKMPGFYEAPNFKKEEDGRGENET